jgi:small subunit ribosomal protein S1
VIHFTVLGGFIMSEGTKIGEYNEGVEFSVAESQEKGITQEQVNYKATKKENTDVSGLEKELIEEAKTQKNSTENSGETFDSIFEEAMSKPLLEYQEGDVVEGTVRSVEKGGILVDFGYKSDGFVPNNETTEKENSETLKTGDPVTIVIEKLETKEGYAVLSIKKASVAKTWNTMAAEAREKKIVSVKVTSKVQGGLVVSYNGVKGFIPASQILKEKNEDLETFLGRDLEASILQSDRRRKKVIFSHKLAASKKNKEESMRILDSIEVGEVKEGKVTSIKDFGVFVDIGGVEGLVHISELSWSRVLHPSDFVKQDQSVKVFVLGIDKENNRISLGMKQLEPDPWVEVAQSLKSGQIIKGKITRIAPFGAFIKINSNLEGLIHISELSEKHIEKPNDVVEVGQEVEAKIIKLVPEEQKIGLSIKRLNSNTENEATEKKEPKRKTVSLLEQEDVIISPIAEAFSEAEKAEQERNDKENENK